MNIALLFPGYGSQYIDMGHELYIAYPLMRKNFAEASQFLSIDFNHICFSSTENELDKPINAYLSIFLISYSIYQLLREHDISPNVFAGFDTGQYAAACSAQGITFFQSLDLLKSYANLYTDFLKNDVYAMIKINGLTQTKLPSFLNKQAFITAYLSRTEHLVAGTKNGILEVKEKLMHDSSATLYEEKLGLGLHSELMNSIETNFIPFIHHINFADLITPIINNATGQFITEGMVLKEEIVTQIHKPLRWDRVVDQLEKVDLVLAIGSKNNLLNYVQEKYPEKRTQAINNLSDIQQIKSFLG